MVMVVVVWCIMCVCAAPKISVCWRQEVATLNDKKEIVIELVSRKQHNSKSMVMVLKFIFGILVSLSN